MQRALFGMDDTKVYLSPAPMYHAAPLRFSLATQALGATVVVMEHFDTERYLAFIEQYRATHTQVVPTMFVRLLKLPDEVRARRTTCRRCDASSTPPRRARSRSRRR